MVSDFQFLKDLASNKWMVVAPGRSKRPNVSKKKSPFCPFCIGNEDNDPEIYRVGGNPKDSNWQIRVIKNKFPFAPVHEVIVHSPDHHKNMDELPLHQVELILETYQHRFLAHHKKGHVYIFNNRGELAGESIPHPHTQLVVVPKEVDLTVRPLIKPDGEVEETNYFTLFCPRTSEWPDEVWIAPKKKGWFGEMYQEEIIDLAFVMQRLLQIYDIRYGHEFPFNFYIAPYKEWYLRLVPRNKILGGFEVGTGIMVNTQDPVETMRFIKTHFQNPDKDLILREHRAEYRKSI